MLRLVISNQTYPFLNIAVENYLLSQPEEDVVTMYLWKNHRTVVIGQNQNPYAECHVELLESEGGHLMRRRTGGGAVYHDDGNLNFSFVAPHKLYNIQRQMSVLQKAVESYGLRTEVSGRNDVVCYDREGQARKFSGNAFNKAQYQHLHHGTILINGNMADIQRYLTVKPAKLQKHGVASVRSRVVNLAELADVTCENIVPRLVAAFEEVYSGKVEEVPFRAYADLPDVQQLCRGFEDDEWRFGRWRNFKAQRKAQFDWGGVEMELDIDEAHAVITRVVVATDCLQPDAIADACQLLEGGSTKQPPQVPVEMSPDKRRIINDIFSMVYGEM